MKEFRERFASLNDVIYGILAEMGLVCVMMLAAWVVGWALARWLS